VTPEKKVVWAMSDGKIPTSARLSIQLLDEPGVPEDMIQQRVSCLTELW